MIDLRQDPDNEDCDAKTEIICINECNEPLLIDAVKRGRSEVYAKSRALEVHDDAEKSSQLHLLI